MIIQNNLKITQDTTTPQSKTRKNLNFSGPRLPHQTFEEFEKFAKETNLLANLKDVFSKENFLNAGIENEVYHIPNNDTFLLKSSKSISLKEKLDQNLKITKAKDIFPLHNLGQKIATIGDNIEVLIKQSGEPNGIKNWRHIVKGEKFTKEYVPEFIQKLNTVANMKQKAYNTFAEEITIIHKKNCEFDEINPGNILVDIKNQAFNIVDVDINAEYSQIPIKDSMLFSLLDKINFSSAYGNSDTNQKNKIEFYAKKIKDKIKTACDKLGVVAKS